MIIQEVADEVLEAFREYNLKPIRNMWISKDPEPCACAIGSLMVKQVGVKELWENNNLYVDTQMFVIGNLQQKYGFGFVEGVVNGFDGMEFDSDDWNIEYYSNGYDTGKYIWNKLNQVTSQ